MDLILSLTTLVLIAAGLAMQIMTRRAWQTAIRAVEDRIGLVEMRAFADAQARLEVAARVADTEAALAELELREAARRAEPTAADLAKTLGFDAKVIENAMSVPHGVRRRRPTKPEGK